MSVVSTEAMYTIRRGGSAELRAAVAIDDATLPMFVERGVIMTMTDDHPYVVAERTRWAAAAASGRLQCAFAGAEPIGFYVLGELDGGAYLDQVSVHPDHGRRGIGRALIEHAWESVVRAGGTALTLTTYAHLPWNAPFYERCGFERLLEATLGLGLRAVLASQRDVLPFPGQRVAMRRVAPAR